jgi:Leucine-rich repeat (LRR) protein
MTVLKFISGILICIFLLINSRSTTRKAESFTLRSTDTVYYASTKQLKSNHIPDSVFQMTNLKHLAIQGMDCDYGDHEHCWEISEIPIQVKTLINLETLSLIVNSIDNVPIELTKLKKLVSVDFSDNAGFQNIDNISKITSLQYLLLYGCGLTKLPDSIGRLINLKYLGLVGNNFDKQEQQRIKKVLPGCSIKF